VFAADLELGVMDKSSVEKLRYITQNLFGVIYILFIDDEI